MCLGIGKFWLTMLVNNLETSEKYNSVLVSSITVSKPFKFKHFSFVFKPQSCELGQNLNSQQISSLLLAWKKIPMKSFNFKLLRQITQIKIFEMLKKKFFFPNGKKPLFLGHELYLPNQIRDHNTRTEIERERERNHNAKHL